MAPKRAAATKGASASSAAVTKANTKAKVTKAAPAAKKPTAAAKAKAAAATTTKAKAPARGRAKKEESVEENGVAEKKKPAAKKAPAKKAAAPEKAAASDEGTPAPAKTSRKRKADSEAPAAPAKKAKLMVKGPVLNEPPTQRLNVYVFGEGTAGELGLGTAKSAVDVKRPRLNPNLKADTVGVVEIAAGGMHCVALTHDNKILTWGVNDQGTLGRDTTWDGGLRDMDAAAEDSDSDDDDDNGLNPKESTPGEVDWSQTELAEGTRFVQVAAGDSTSFVLTDDGKVYGWGTFRSNDGVFGFSPEVHIAERPILVSGLKKITSIKAGANHALAMDTTGAVFAWGSGQQNQLGRRVIERTKTEGLHPREFGLPKGAKKGITSIETGGYHSFAISKTGDVYAWGLNNFGETGIMDNAGQDDAVIVNPRQVPSLKGKDLISIKGGGHHSLAATAEGDCLIWGRIDGNQTGFTKDELNKMPDEVIIKDEHGAMRIIKEPQKISAIKGKVVQVTTSSDNNIVITDEGKAWSWGFSANYQTGLGTDDDVIVATCIENTAVKDQKIIGAGCGGQFSFLTSAAA
ncbi:unnamed protein product [Zymoseptoria tritici ST99CH_3D7]|uniref:RCC1-like domain-containing protein n=1 Tax=Zymoseptoria tritici (strain ST99CH_3D7) TaxID=1276538 RepID=A0A1X7RNQ2_ZYMT9|nr:unnamed protein product [Zymoseptoria tritici ST99CH_3D7]